jgi:hypothetical protein
LRGFAQAREADFCIFNHVVSLGRVRAESKARLWEGSLIDGNPESSPLPKGATVASALYPERRVATDEFYSRRHIASEAICRRELISAIL